jgi:hypothetical protein
LSTTIQHRNGLGRIIEDEPSLDPTVLLLVEELKRSNDNVRLEMRIERDGQAQRDKMMLEAISSCGAEIGAMRGAFDRFATYALVGILTVALVALLGLVGTRGVDPGDVAAAAASLVPGVDMFSADTGTGR